jgi:hypothetical protein
MVGEQYRELPFLDRRSVDDVIDVEVEVELVVDRAYTSCKGRMHHWHCLWIQSTW